MATPARSIDFFERAVDICHKSLLQRLFDAEGDLIQLTVRDQLRDQFVTGLDFVRQAQIQSTRPVPMLTCRDLFKVETRPVSTHRRFKKRVYIFELFFKFGAVFVRILTEHRNGAFVLTRSDLFEIDTMTIQHTIEIGYLCDHTNGPQNGEWRRVNLAGNTGLQIAAARSDLIEKQ